MKITLCGSTRFRDEFELWNRRLSKQGHVVYSVSCFGHSGDPLTADEKETLDRVHKEKIDASDAILVLNRDGYIGDSTRSEIEHAETVGKRIFYLFHHSVDFDVWERQNAKQICPYDGCFNSTNYGPCALCYE